MQDGEEHGGGGGSGRRRQTPNREERKRGSGKEKWRTSSQMRIGDGFRDG